MDRNGSTPTADVRTGRSKSRALLAAVAVFALALAASCGGASAGGGGGSQQPAKSGAQEDAPAKEEQALGSESLGDADAPVVLTEYADYQ